MQYDYLAAYVSFYRDAGKSARAIAKKYAEHPVPKWRARFAEVLTQLDQVAGGEDEVHEEHNRDQQLGAAADQEAAVDIKVEGGKVVADVVQAEKLELSFYPMDIELLFSQQPFLEAETARFRYIRPAKVVTVDVPKNGIVSVPLPAEYAKANFHVEAEAGGALDGVTHLSSDLRVRIMEQAGHLEVRQAAGKRPALAAAYVKVYAMLNNGTVRFWKDGYTDLRGRFDFVSRNDLAPSDVARFSILVVHDEHGAVLEEAGVPVQ